MINISRAAQIRMLYPDEPDWALEADEVLIELVKNYDQEFACASSALCELSLREHPQVTDFCVLLLTAPEADKWLKLTALSSFPIKKLHKGLDAAAGLLDQCDVEILEMLARQINYALQVAPTDAVRCHPVTQKILGQRLASCRETLYFAGTYSQEDLRQGRKLATPLFIPFSKGMMILGGWGGALGLWSLVRDPGFAAPGLQMLLLGMLLLFFGIKFHQLIENTQENNPELLKHYYGILNQNGFEINSENSWRAAVWSDMTNWNASNDSFVITMPGAFFLFPLAHFSSREEWEKAKTWCAVNLPRLETNTRSDSEK